MWNKVYSSEYCTGEEQRQKQVGGSRVKHSLQLWVLHRWGAETKTGGRQPCETKFTALSTAYVRSRAETKTGGRQRCETKLQLWVLHRWGGRQKQVGGSGVKQSLQLWVLHRWRAETKTGGRQWNKVYSWVLHRWGAKTKTGGRQCCEIKFTALRLHTWGAETKTGGRQRCETKLQLWVLHRWGGRQKQVGGSGVKQSLQLWVLHRWRAETETKTGGRQRCETKFTALSTAQVRSKDKNRWEAVLWNKVYSSEYCIREEQRQKQVGGSRVKQSLQLWVLHRWEAETRTGGRQRCETKFTALSTAQVRSKDKNRWEAVMWNKVYSSEYCIREEQRQKQVGGSGVKQSLQLWVLHRWEAETRTGGRQRCETKFTALSTAQVRSKDKNRWEAVMWNKVYSSEYCILEEQRQKQVGGSGVKQSLQLWVLHTWGAETKTGGRQRRETKFTTLSTA